jgi:hypothetical protein
MDINEAITIAQNAITAEIAGFSNYASDILEATIARYESALKTLESLRTNV